MNKKGEPRSGGMPLGWRKPEGVRSQHQVRAYPDEWELIQQFVKLLRRCGVNETKDFLSQFAKGTLKDTP